MPRVNMAWKYGLERARRARWAGIRWSSATSTTSQNWLCRRCSLRPRRTSTAWSTQRNTCKHHNTASKHTRKQSLALGCKHGSQKAQLSKQWEANSTVMLIVSLKNDIYLGWLTDPVGATHTVWFAIVHYVPSDRNHLTGTNRGTGLTNTVTPGLSCQWHMVITSSHAELRTRKAPGQVSYI